MLLKGKRTIVTGAGRGIGRGIALRYGREGADVLVANRTADVAQEVAQQIVEAGGSAVWHQVDVTDRAQVDEMVKRAVDEFGGVDVLVANAGICDPAPFLEITEESWDRHIEINLKGIFLCGQAVAQAMVDQGTRGTIINMTSVNGISGEADQAHYNSSKGGMSLLTKSMAIDLAQYGITVNGIAPGFIDTRLTRPTIDNEPAIQEYVKGIPLSRVGTPDEVAGTAVFLATDDAKYVTGHLLVVDGGQIAQL